jgi:hypothetical protein
MKADLNSLILALAVSGAALDAESYPVVDTGQAQCYDASRPIPPPRSGAPFFGQDAQYAGRAPAYRDNGDGTVTDLNTGLMWSRAVDPRKVDLAEAQPVARAMTLGGHQDWRVPTIKELYSLIDFRGASGMARPESRSAPATAVPYIDTDFFDFRYGDAAAGERYIDAQWLSSTEYTGRVMDGMRAIFGVNFADGRIKGYGERGPDGREKKFYARYVRGGEGYGRNDFVDNRDGTITDRATGLTWSQVDGGRAMTWPQALAYAENLVLAGHDDWRLPNAKELQSIVDYTRSPDATDSPALSPLFRATPIRNEAGQKDWGFYWTSTTHLDGPNASQAVYVAFGRAMGEMHGRVMDVHGAGAQRSDPKTGFPRIGRGPQGDAQRARNFVRVVRGGNVTLTPPSAAAAAGRYPDTIRVAGRAYRPQPLSFNAPAQPQAFGEGGNASRPSAEKDGPSDLIQRLDRDGDGRISRQEFDGPPNGFSRADRNRDGYLSSEEARSLPIPPGGRPPGSP